VRKHHDDEEEETETVAVPEDYHERTFRFSASEPITITARRGRVKVPKAHVHQFLSIVKGSHIVDGNPGDEEGEE
jgi:hypothetical protein